MTDSITHETWQTLRSIAGVEQRNIAEIMNYYQPIDCSVLCRSLYHLALATTGQSAMTDDQILPTFFKADAVEQLLKLPNTYWFWRIVKNALVHHCSSFKNEKATNQSNQNKIELGSIKAAMAAERRAASLANLAYSRQRDPANLNNVETATWVAAGLLLVDVNGGHATTVVANPVFEYDTKAVTIPVPSGALVNLER